jgi:hypothetical protein
MPTEPQYNGYRNPGVEYDRSDLGAKGILIFFIVLGVFAIFMHVLVLALYAGMTRVAESQDRVLSPLAPQTYTPRQGILTNTANVNAQQFPEPRLSIHMSQKAMGQNSQPGEMTTFLVQEAAVITAKPWQDQQGNVHLPIDQAMATVLGRLPVRAGAQAQPPMYPGAAREYSYAPLQGESANRPVEMEQQNPAMPSEEQQQSETPVAPATQQQQNSNPGR